MSLPPYYLQEPPPIFDHTPSMFEPMDDPGFAQSIECKYFNLRINVPLNKKFYNNNKSCHMMIRTSCHVII